MQSSIKFFKIIGQNLQCLKVLKEYEIKAILQKNNSNEKLTNAKRFYFASFIESGQYLQSNF